MKQLLLLILLTSQVGCVSVPRPQALAGCYRVEFTSSRPWLKFNGRDVEIDPSMSVHLYPDTHPYFVEGSGFFRSVPLIGNPPDAKEYFWRVLDGNLALRLGGDSAGISVIAKIVPNTNSYPATATPYIDIGPTEYNDSNANVFRIQCPAMGANNSFKPNLLRGGSGRLALR